MLLIYRLLVRSTIRADTIRSHLNSHCGMRFRYLSVPFVKRMCNIIEQPTDCLFSSLHIVFFVQTFNHFRAYLYTLIVPNNWDAYTRLFYVLSYLIALYFITITLIINL